MDIIHEQQAQRLLQATSSHNGGSIPYYITDNFPEHLKTALPSHERQRLSGIERLREALAQGSAKFQGNAYTASRFRSQVHNLDLSKVKRAVECLATASLDFNQPLATNVLEFSRTVFGSKLTDEALQSAQKPEIKVPSHERFHRACHATALVVEAYISLKDHDVGDNAMVLTDIVKADKTPTAGGTGLSIWVRLCRA